VAIRIISRKAARARGLRNYFTGEPCKRGHIAERAVSGCCVECRRVRARERWAADPKYREAQQTLRANNPDLAAGYAREHRARDPEKYRKANRDSKRRAREAIKADKLEREKRMAAKEQEAALKDRRERVKAASEGDGALEALERRQALRLPRPAWSPDHMPEDLPEIDPEDFEP
jgi:hypothetical protein